MKAIESLILVAGSTRTREVVQVFRSVENEDGRNQACLGMMFAMAGLGILAAVLVILQRRWKKSLKTSPRGLFLELCHAHRLKRWQRRLLWHLAGSQKLTDPACVFLKPECFEIGRLTVEMRPHVEELRGLRELLFAETRETPKVGRGVGLQEFHEVGKPSAALPVSPLPPTLELPSWPTNMGMGVGD